MEATFGIEIDTKNVSMVLRTGEDDESAVMETIYNKEGNSKSAVNDNLQTALNELRDLANIKAGR